LRIDFDIAFYVFDNIVLLVDNLVGISAAHP
jgi:hypothetical protein